MNKFLFSFIAMALMLASMDSFAEKACSVKLNTRSHLDQVTNQELIDIAKQVVLDSDIQLVTGESTIATDYALEVYAHLSVDHHNARFAHIHAYTQIWPAHQIQERSAVETPFGTKFMKRRKLTKELQTKLVTQTLTVHLESCESIRKIIASNGNGTLNPVDGGSYTTKTGAVFKRYGTYWMDPSGLQWGEILAGEYKNVGNDSAAVKACETLGARLPTADEFRNLMNYFSKSTDRNHTLSDEGKFEFNALFPWSFGMYTTATRDESGVGYDFHHIAGVSSPAMAHWELNVRCVK